MVAGPGPANMILITVGLKYGLNNSIRFLIGVILSKQIIIWPVGLGLLSISIYAPKTFLILKYLSVLYILWLAWKFLFVGLKRGTANVPPSFFAGLLVHPFNPKAWLMVVASFSSFTNFETSPIYQTGIVAIIFFISQCFFHSIWLILGSKISELLRNKKLKAIFIFLLSVLTVISVIPILV